jgi:hypothetical protein
MPPRTLSRPQGRRQCGPSQGDDAQGCDSKAPKDKPSSNDDDGIGDCHVFYHRIGNN